MAFLNESVNALKMSNSFDLSVLQKMDLSSPTEFLPLHLCRPPKE